MSDAVVMGVSVAWYTPEAWERLAAMPEAQIELTYQEYVRKTEAIERQYAAEGVPFKRAVIDAACLADMIEWCRLNGYELDGRGRAVYGAARALNDDRPLKGKPVVDKTRSIQ
jgi:hypothetical protein